MSSQIYNWKRFWCPRTGSIDLSDGGYLSDPDSEFGHLYNAGVVSFNSISEISCLVLLGEPGIGKTQTLQSQRRSIDREIEKKGDRSIWQDLRSYASEDRLVHDLFERATFVSWTKSACRIYLFLDSLDECLLRINTMAALLVDKLEKYPVERLYLRIACRTADWPSGLEEGLKRLWGGDQVRVYELAPLRRKDVVQAARTNKLDSAAFLSEIDRTKAVPFAIKPVTLVFLLNTYRRTRRFPSTQRELYFEGCRLLCEEPSVNRRDARLIGSLTVAQRLAIAGRIAAVTVFANRYAIWTGADLGGVPEEDVTTQELCGGAERVGREQLQVTEASVRETLGSGLFSSRGPNRLGWAHHTYAEFLAARFLVEQGMSLPQMLSLIAHSGDPEGRVVPQLYECAAWLGGMEPHVFRHIVKVDPEVLLRSDVATTDVKDRAALVDTLLKQHEQEELPRPRMDVREGYKNFHYPGLAEQLRQYLRGQTKGELVRRVAIDIARACNLQALQDDLVDITLDCSQPYRIRIGAAYAIVHLGDASSKKRLRPLALGEAGDDPDDELKGCGLRAVWPAHMTAEELFANLTPPKRGNFIGSYQRFLVGNVAPHLQPSDLPLALRWAKKQQLQHKLPHAFDELVDSIMLQSWNYLESPEVLSAFAEVALSRLKNHERIVSGSLGARFGRMLENNDHRRRMILQTFVQLFSDPGRASVVLIWAPRGILLSRDLPWMVEQLRTAISDKNRTVWARLIGARFDWDDKSHLRSMRVARWHSRLLARTFPWWKLMTGVHCPFLFRLYLRMTRGEFKLEAVRRFVPKLATRWRINRLLNKCESGDPDAWWHLNIGMMLDEQGRRCGHELESDLTAFPGWKAAGAATRERIATAAKRYLLEQGPETDKWLGTNVIHHPAFAGYRALRLLLREDPRLLSDIPADVWKTWAPIILAYPTAGGTGDEVPHHDLVRMAYHNAPAEVLRTLITLIDKENREEDTISITRKMEHCWDPRLADALLTKAKDERLKPDCMGTLLGDLLGHGIEAARVFAESLVPAPPPSAGDRRSRAVVAARVLMTHAEDAGWPVVWPSIQQNAQFGKDVIGSVAHGLDRSSETLAQRLREEQLGDLYIWLARQYPYAEDPKPEKAHFVGLRENIAEFRDDILRYLQDYGTRRACNVLRRIISELPEVKWLKWTLVEAQNITRRRTWVPTRPGDIIKMASDQQVCLVQNGDQLLEAIIESLKRLEMKLQGEQPAAFDLWNEVNRNVYRPKDEGYLSDYVKRHLGEDLKQRGVVVNREVEIRRGAGSGQGEITDIHVDAIVRGPEGDVLDSVTVIIEAKGCWNPDLNQAMKTQLVDRYLKDNQCQHGLYLVGWFKCDQWDNADSRKKRTPRLRIEEAQKQLDGQAVSLSQKGTHIKAFVLNVALR